MAKKSKKKEGKKLTVMVGFAVVLAPSMFFGPKLLSGTDAPIKPFDSGTNSKTSVAVPKTPVTQAQLPQSNRNPFK